jgi:uncharacterized protein YaaQ
VASAGGFLQRGNTTLFIGVEDEKVDDVLAIIKHNCHPHQETLPEILRRPVFTTQSIGAAVVFVFDMEQFERIGPTLALDTQPPTDDGEDG